MGVCMCGYIYILYTIEMTGISADGGLLGGRRTGGYPAGGYERTYMRTL